ncbi:bifunctional diaminohydroxyphosphoribosylaminopyrimidine deaminase/5-amino-6-(5-phosphoribosylamino)uracil reductase RibD [Cystobacter fuscus]|uniref:bifunctional diaminohydroxyphosphoribosylaminopyrimidine deaminase/5-amino-6-(5-phosphoribosylamino)uracil reductase RibD n=1 Tax=Cystobacter fuscus TaxID=43 RepID=UPI002B2FE3E0|nr:bifunctional diaminohydroxyphosphoribosylaminopyrimidine deaminase/5-amino-6-(5-phosphoribosylamino)uracil reductase RibD [Cystobacter fuscus]
MRLLTRARLQAGRAPRAKRTADFDRAVAEFFMRLALEEAAKGLGRTSPNPVVGAVLVKGGRIIARGYHRRAGTAHAEVVALEAAGAKARGADLYTTLEPCDHYGRTPPCSQALIDAGVRRVITASSDPNPKVNGKGVARLRRAGVEVLTGVLKDEADQLNRPFFKAMRTGLPFVTLKAAVTLDGKLATATGDSRWVTGEEARAWVHRLRDRVDVILVGATTARRDNPQLTTRLPGGAGKDPVRVVVDSHLRLPSTLQVFTQRSSARTVVATLEDPTARKAKRLLATGADVWQLPEKQGRVDLEALMRRLAKVGLNHVLVEGGAEMYGSFLREELADELLLFVAPKLIGGEGLSWSGSLGVKQMARALTVSPLSFEQVGADLLLRARLSEPKAHGT